MTTIHPNNPNRTTTMNAIGYSEWGYDNLIHQYFVTWCEAIADKFYYQGRDLITNESLWKYYQRQWHILVECQMVNDYGSYMAAKIPDTNRFFYNLLCGYANELENYYPASLLRAKQKQKPSKPKYEFNYN